MKENHPKSQLPGVGLILVQPWVEIKEQKYCSFLNGSLKL